MVMLPSNHTDIWIWMIFKNYVYKKNFLRVHETLEQTKQSDCNRKQCPFFGGKQKKWGALNLKVILRGLSWPCYHHPSVFWELSRTVFLAPHTGRVPMAAWFPHTGRLPILWSPMPMFCLISKVLNSDWFWSQDICPSLSCNHLCF